MSFISKLKQWAYGRYLHHLSKGDAGGQRPPLYQNDYLANAILMAQKKQLRLVIYTCIINGYDHLADPLFCSPNIHYVAFTDDPSFTSTFWETRPLPEIIRNYTPGMANRYLKFHPFDFFCDSYDAAIYVDGNVQIVQDPMPLAYLVSSNIGIGVHKHCLRKDVYDEAYACLGAKRGKKKAIARLMRRYRNEGFPKGFGLFECTIIVYNLHNQNGKRIAHRVFTELVNSDCGRDQLILPYVIWRQGVPPDDVCRLGNNVWLNPFLHIATHAK